MTIEQIINQVKENDPKADTAKIMAAYSFAKTAHGDQLRKTGEPYIQHPLHTAFILAQIKADVPTIMAGLLHDVPEDTEHNINEVRQTFGSEVAELVDGMTKLGKLKYRGIDRYAESMRKMFLAMTTDLRVILIKFADRLHNLRTLEGVKPDKRVRIAKESLEIYAPIAGLLGIWRLKWQMEDICFKYLHPEEYKKVEYRYEIEKKSELNQYIQKVKTILTEKLKEEGVAAEIDGRFKHLYSIWQKMENKHRKFDEIYDVFALRVVVPTVADCYKVLGIIHSLWRPNYNRFKDYIAVSKPNGYSSLHTTVFGPEGKATEFQIRTRQMHEEASYGIAAHWSYKQKNGSTGTQQPDWVQNILNIQKDAKDSQDFLRQVKLDIFHDRIFVFTPKGDVYDLPEHATPVDFAYAVHTDIGDKCSKAMVNGKITQLDQELRSGDLVEIIVEKNRKGPNTDWLKFVKTKRAQEKIKLYTRRARLTALGKSMGGKIGKYIPTFRKNKK